MVTNNIEEIIKLVRQQVIQGLEIIERQHILIQQLNELGRDTREAEHSLELFGQSIPILERPRAELERERQGVP